MDLVHELEKIPTEKPYDRPIVAVKITRAQGQELLDPQPIENWQIYQKTYFSLNKTLYSLYTPFMFFYQGWMDGWMLDLDMNDVLIEYSVL